MIDVVFISYCESNAEENWRHLLSLYPHAKRVNGVKGIARAHQEAAKVSETEFFFTVDGDNFILPNFKFSLPQPNLDPTAIYVWRARNPVNDLVYGFGGVKIYSKTLLRERKEKRGYGDFATTITRNYVVVNALASETRFNATPLEAWRGAFREVTKLAVNFKKDQGDVATKERLNTWLLKGMERLNGEWALCGAREGFKFAEQVFQGAEKIERINDFEWLKSKFNNQ